MNVNTPTSTHTTVTKARDLSEGDVIHHRGHHCIVETVDADDGFGIYVTFERHDSTSPLGFNFAPNADVDVHTV